MSYTKRISPRRRYIFLGSPGKLPLRANTPRFVSRFINLRVLFGIEWNVKMIMDGEMESTWKIVAVAYFRYFS